MSMTRSQLSSASTMAGSTQSMQLSGRRHMTSESQKLSQHLTELENLEQLQEVVNLVQKSQNHDSSIEVKMSDPVITLYTSKNVQSPQKLLEQLAKEKGFMNSPIIIVENISKVTSSASMTTQNTTTSHSPPNLYVSMPTPDSTSLSSQSSSSTSQEVHRCEECDYSSHNKHYLKQHVDLVHCASRPYKCPFCNYAGKRSHSLREHLMVHSNERPFVCIHCHATFRKKGHLTNHVKLHQKMVPCPICKMPISQPKVEPHMKSVHNVDKLYVCDVCSHMAVNKTEIEDHLKLHKTQGPQMYVCEMCNHWSKSFEHFCAHAETHRDSINENNKMTETDELKKSTEKMKKQKSESNLTMERKLMKCSECGFVSGEITEMKDHMLVHIQQEDANESNKQESQKSKQAVENVQKPQQSSTAEGKSTYKCVECEFSCDEAYVFVVHMLTHRPDLQIHTDKTLDYPEQLQAKQGHPQPQIMNEMVVQPKRSDQMQKLPLSKTIKLQKIIPKPAQEMVNVPGLQMTNLIGQPIEIKQDLTKGSISQDSNTTNQNTENLPFVYNTTNAKFRCTICGYTCDYQRTIKAHIWKHSGNKDIDYPMFQNGPLSIYEDSPILEGDKTKATPVDLPVNQEDDTFSCNQQVYNTKTVVVEKVVQVNKMSSVSPVAPVLANMLAMRARQKDGDYIYPDQSTIIRDNGITQETTATSAMSSMVSPSGASSKELNVISVQYIDGMQIQNKGVDSSAKQKLEEKVVFVLPDQRLMSSKIKDDISTDKSCVDQYHILAKNSSDKDNEDNNLIIDTEVLPIATNTCKSTAIVPNLATDSINLKRKLEHINSQNFTIKRVCTEESKNVVVETVDNSNLTSYTSMKSQQNSPRAVSEVSQSELSDSGVGSDTNPVVALKLDKMAVDPQERDEMIKESTVFQDFGTEVTVSSSVEYDKISTEEALDIDSDNDESTTCESDLDMNEEVSYVKKRERMPSSSMTESAVTLLSLLKKGPNENPACPSNVKTETTTSTDSLDSEDKPKQGISSSLLAVIEQLRERSKNESEVEEFSGSKKSNKKRIKRELLEDLAEIENMGNVERIEEEGEVRFRCKLCHYSNLSTFVIKQHMRLHKTKQPFECSLCDFIATSSESLQDHMIQHCKVRTYQCKLCSSAFNYKSQLRAHMRAHTEKEVFVCDDCDHETTNPVSFRNHVRGHNEKKQYKCEVCDRKFISKYELKNHKKQLCSQQKSFQCYECDFVAIGPQEQKLHAKIHNKEFKCAKCEYNTTSITRFENHAKIHDEPKTLKCELCDFPAVSNRSLKSHMKRHINDQRFVQQPLEQYKCNLCGYVCHHLPSLKSHMWRHASDQNYSYEFTNEVINAAIDYDSRLDTYECQKDDIRAFFQTIRQKLKDRLEGMNATGDAQSAACWVTFRCCQCGFETINKAELNVHMKSHSDIIKWTLQVNDKQKKEKT